MDSLDSIREVLARCGREPVTIRISAWTWERLQQSVLSLRGVEPREAMRVYGYWLVVDADLEPGAFELDFDPADV